MNELQIRGYWTKGFITATTTWGPFILKEFGDHYLGTKYR